MPSTIAPCDCFSAADINPLVRGKPHASAQSVRPGRREITVGGRDASKGATDMWVIGSALVSLTNMGHKRPRPKGLADKLLQIREALGLSQKEMAERLAELAGIKITSNNISKYERDRSVPFIEIVLAYARLAHVEMNQIVDDDLNLNV